MASIIIIAVVFVLDVLAFVLAIGAERRRSYVREIHIYTLLANIIPAPCLFLLIRLDSV
jgi:hypothetical protein